MKDEDTKPEFLWSTVEVTVYSLDVKNLGNPIGKVEMPCEHDESSTSTNFALKRLELALWYHEWWFKET